MQGHLPGQGRAVFHLRFKRFQSLAFEPAFPAHTLMHGANKFGLASLTNLDQVPPTGAILITAPLKIEKGSGSPLRVLALVAA